MLRIDLADLNTVRLICRRCSTPVVVELPVEDLHRALDKGRCRFCDQEIVADEAKVLSQISQAFRVLGKLKDIGIEFEIPATK